MLKVPVVTSSTFADWLHEEARVLTAISHPNVVGLRGRVQKDGEEILALEALEGEDIATLLAREGRQSPSTLLALLGPLADALDYLHGQGFVHGDVKPANVVVTQDAGPVLVDFGLARSAHGDGSRTQGLLAGTPQYMAPEQVFGLPHEQGPAIDRYALAAMALEILTGHRPYASAAIGELLAAMIERSPRMPSQLGWAGLDTVFARALARDPERRYQTAREFVEALARALENATPSTRPDSLRPLAPTVRATPYPRAA